MADPYVAQPREPYPDPAAPAGVPDSTAPKSEQAREVAGHAADSAKQVAADAGDQAAAVRDSAVSAAADVVEEAKAEASVVLDEAKEHGRRLYAESMAELRTQAETGQVRLAELVRSLTDELQEMVSAGSQRGPVTEVAAALHDAGDRAASWLESRGPQDAVADVRRYAASNPVVFLAAAAGLGFVGSRLVRGLRDADNPTTALPRQRFAGEGPFSPVEAGHPSPLRQGTGVAGTADAPFRPAEAGPGWAVGEGQAAPGATQPYADRDRFVGDEDPNR